MWGAAAVLGAALGALAGDPGPASCAWGQSGPWAGVLSFARACTAPSAGCDAPGYRGPYPDCAVFQYGDRRPIPCIGDAGACAGAAPPPPASWHVHVFFPNVDCANCSEPFTREAANFTFDGALELRAAVATFLNAEAARIAGAPSRDPIDAARARTDVAYDRCETTYHIAAGAPANFVREPCIYEVDAVKRPGPFTDPDSDLGYPNWSFFVPSDFWLPGLRASLIAWLASRHGKYDVLVHPNTGCETRDHVDPKSPDITWLGTPRPLKPAVFSCNALGCNQACPSDDPPPANCSASA